LKIVIDTREQKGWTFNPKQVDVVRRALWAGDYSVVGLEREIAIERKSLGDFVQTVIHDWLRFRKELIRLSGYQLAVIAVEATVLQAEVVDDLEDVGEVEQREIEAVVCPGAVLHGQIHPKDEGGLDQ
jgi:ERCC4-type nuclease